MMRDALGRVLGRRPPALQVGAICFSPETGRVLLITSRGTGRWIIPKGWPMSGRSAAGAAEREAWEEAGVRGEVSQQPLGRYAAIKSSDGGVSLPVEVQVHLIRVHELADDYPEVGQRSRRWFLPLDAAGLVHEDGLKALLRDLRL
ncbi:MAG: NUDIX hydrolase [Paracoccus sp. (in: a-proteobacteria)]|nr:NUDIX hydrolase [Paracoccus sp. (in: a-proteobacteria)]